ncbi:hypothetical protein FBU30_001577 [Linnemannia zychae]|nr:hypothetical protein FBU30_001577 [Linnemannia zychae]
MRKFFVISIDNGSFKARYVRTARVDMAAFSSSSTFHHRDRITAIGVLSLRDYLQNQSSFVRFNTVQEQGRTKRSVASVYPSMNNQPGGVLCLMANGSHCSQLDTIYNLWADYIKIPSQYSLVFPTPSVQNNGDSDEERSSDNGGDDDNTPTSKLVLGKLIEWLEDEANFSVVFGQERPRISPKPKTATKS